MLTISPLVGISAISFVKSPYLPDHSKMHSGCLMSMFITLSLSMAFPLMKVPPSPLLGVEVDLVVAACKKPF
jgi:hypothetical protein